MKGCKDCPILEKFVEDCNVIIGDLVLGRLSESRTEQVMERWNAMKANLSVLEKEEPVWVS